MFIADAHLDLAMNAMEWNRDLRRPINELREREKGLNDKPDRGENTVCFPEMRKGNVGLCVATLIARYVKPSNPLPGWHSPEQAWAQTQAQFAWYQEMVRLGEMRQITTARELNAHLESWGNQNVEDLPIGFVLSLEGADSILEPELLTRSYEQGLRIIGPAHYGPGTYAMGTHTTGGFNAKGKALLREMDVLHMVLDVTHLSDACFWEAMDLFKGPIWASHSNCRSLVPDQRQFSDDQLKALIARDAVIGAAFDAWMLVPGWQRGISNPSNTSILLKDVVNHIDHICQLAGNTRHSALGTDLDGGFGREQSPGDIDTIADLQKLPELLRKKGYSDADLTQIMHQNIASFLHRALP
jgi:membrane dipeptidase